MERVGQNVVVGIHTHNDAECGVANSLAAVEAERLTCKAPSTDTASAPATRT